MRNTREAAYSIYVGFIQFDSGARVLMEIAKSLGKSDLVSIKALQLSISSGMESTTNQWDGSYVRNTRIAAERAYKEAGIDKPREQLSLIEVHDCFSTTELVTMEDLFISDMGLM